MTRATMCCMRPTWREMHDALVKAGYDGVMMDDRDGSVNGRIYYLFDKSLAERKEKVR